MRRTIPAAAMLSAFASRALAQRQGFHSAESEGGNGQPYRGAVMPQPPGQNTWEAGADTATGVGVLIPEGPLLVVGYVMAGRDIGVVAYAVQPDGRLIGTRAQRAGGGIGT